MEKLKAGPDGQPPEGVTEWVGASGWLRIAGEDYDLRQMEPDELQALVAQLALDAGKIRAQLAEAEMEREVAGFLGYERLEWRNRARLALNLKKKAMTAIHAEFARRSHLVPPLSDFAFPAIYQVYGEAGMAQVESVARELQAQHMQQFRYKGRPPSRRPSERQHVCGDKIRHPNEEAAIAQIEQMAAAGAEVKDLKVYPCPWCNHFHVGNDPYRRQKAKRRARKAGASPTQT